MSLLFRSTNRKALYFLSSSEDWMFRTQFGGVCGGGHGPSVLCTIFCRSSHVMRGQQRDFERAPPKNPLLDLQLDRLGASVALPGDLSGSTPSCFSSENGAGPLTPRFEDPGGPLFGKQSRELLPGRRLTAFTIDPSADSVSPPPVESPATVSRLAPDFASHRAAARYKIHLSSWPNCPGPALVTHKRDSGT